MKLHVIYSSTYTAKAWRESQWRYCSYSRCKCWVVFCTKVVRVKVEHSNHKGEKHHDENDHEFEDVFHSPSQRDLERTKTFIGWEYVCNTGEAEHHSYCI